MKPAFLLLALLFGLSLSAQPGTTAGAVCVGPNQPFFPIVDSCDCTVAENVFVRPGGLAKFDFAAERAAVFFYVEDNLVIYSYFGTADTVAQSVAADGDLKQYGKFLVARFPDCAWIIADLESGDVTSYRTPLPRSLKGTAKTTQANVTTN